MYPELFNQCIEIILRHEGGYVNDPDDLGGETKYGIAKRFFPNEDIKNLTKDRAKYLYFNFYWHPMNLMGITDPLAILHIFDMGVNAGKGNAIRMAQRIAQVKPDGKMGPVSRSAINLIDDFTDQYIAARKKYYILISFKRNNKKFLQGWLNRVDTTHF